MSDIKFEVIKARQFCKPANFSNIVVSYFHSCPECDQEYYLIHPDTDCYYGIVERIMES